MKKLILIPLIFLLAGCGLTNEEIIAETKKCKDAGMEAERIFNGITYDITKIQCGEKTRSSAEICEEQGGVPIMSGWGGLDRCEFKK